jgi:hypothetical protein
MNGAHALLQDDVRTSTGGGRRVDATCNVDITGGIRSMTQYRGLKSLALAVTLGLAVVGLSQCRLVEDTVTGVDLSSTGNAADRADCVKQCNEAFKAAEAAEDARYEAAIRACGKDRTCIEREVAKTKESHAKNVEDMQTCKRSCYNEGTGGGGAR